MSKITAQYTMSKKRQREEYIATGEKPASRHEISLDLAPLTPEQRQPIIDLAARGILELSRRKVFNPANKLDQYLEAETVTYDTEPTTPEIVAFCTDQLEQYAKAATHTTHVKKANEEKKRAEATLTAILTTELDNIKDDLDALCAWTYKGAPQAVYNHYRELLRDARKKSAETAKKEWIAAYGTNHLREAYERGYDCQRLYVTERAATDFPNYDVDYDNEARWLSRCCPTKTALEEVERIENLCVVEAVWLTQPAKNSVDDFDYFEFEPCEAIVIKKWLGRYDLVRII